MTIPKVSQEAEPDMSWIDIAVQEGGRNAVVIACSDGWKDYLAEFYIEDCIETSVAMPTEAGLHRWSGFNVGYWGEDELCQINGGTFTSHEQLIRSKVIDEAAGVAEAIAASNDAAERKHHNEARASTSLSGHATALEYAVGFAKSARTAREIALAIRQLGERGRG